MAISRSGERIAVGTGSGVVVYDGDTRKPIGEISSAQAVGVYITRADDFFVATFGGELTQYDLETLEPIRPIGGSCGYVQEMYGTGDGSVIAVRGGDRTVTLYDVETGARMGAPIMIPESDFPVVALSYDGSTMAVGGGRDNGVQVWSLEPDEWVEAACRLAGRDLTRAEWVANIGDLADYRPTCPQFPFEGGQSNV